VIGIKSAVRRIISSYEGLIMHAQVASFLALPFTP
jgi:hypothetical protein